MKTILLGMWLILFASGCAYFRWESERPWNAPLADDPNSALNPGARNENRDGHAPRAYK